MVYLIALPCILGGIAVSISDCATKRIPRTIIVISTATQLCLVIVMATLSITPWMQVAYCLSTCAVSTTVQWILSRLSRHQLGLGDVTTTAMMSWPIGIAAHSFVDILTLIAWWYMLMGVLGLTHMLVEKYALKQSHTSIPFAPSIVLSALITVGLSLL